MKQKLQFTAVLLVIVIVLGVLSFFEYQGKEKLVFVDSLDEVVLTVDGRELTLRDIAFYIAYEEGEIEKAARVYNPENTDEYWKLYTNHTFFREEGKQAVLDMAVHDEIFYQLAIAEGMELSEEEETHLLNDCYDFWSDLEEEQRLAIGVSEEVLTESMRKIALAEKYQYLLSGMKQKSVEEYSFSGQAYEKLLEEHEYTVEENIWERVPFGSVTVNH